MLRKLGIPQHKNAINEEYMERKSHCSAKIFKKKRLYTSGFRYLRKSAIGGWVRKGNPISGDPRHYGYGLKFHYPQIPRAASNGRGEIWILQIKPGRDFVQFLEAWGNSVGDLLSDVSETHAVAGTKSIYTK